MRIYKRKIDKRYSKNYSYNFSLNGKRFRGSCKTSNYQLAKSYVKQLYVETYTKLMLKNQQPQTQEKEEQHIKDITRLYVENNKKYLDSISKERKSQINLTIKLANEYFNNNSLTKNNVYKFFDHISQTRKISNTTLTKYLETFKAIIEFGYSRGYLNNNILKEMDFSYMYKDKVNRTNYLKKEEYSKILKHRLSSEIGDEILFAINTGVRLSEQLNLTWDRCYIREKNPYIYLDKTKNNIPRKIYLPKICVDILEKRRHLEKPFEIAKGTLHHKWKIMLKECTIIDFRWHDLRHTFASWAIQGWHKWQSKAMDIYSLKDWLGHTKINMTQKYAHLSNSYLASQISYSA